MSKTSTAGTGGMVLRLGAILFDYPKVVNSLELITQKKLERRRWQEGCILIQLAELDRPALNRLQEVLAENSSLDASIRGALKDIACWVYILENPNKIGETKPRTLSMFCDLLSEYILGSPNRHIYQRNEDISLAYLATSVEFEEATNDTKAQVSLTMVCHSRGEIHSRSLTWYGEDIRGQTLSQILDREGFVLENPALRLDYDYDCELYVDYVSVVGRQFLAVGQANPIGDEEGNRYSYYGDSYDLAAHSSASRVVIDIISKKKTTKRETKIRDLRYKINRDLDEELEEQEIPLHPFVECFDLNKHRRISVHVRNLTPYVYDKEIASKLIIPDEQRHIIDILTNKDSIEFRDVIGNKGGGRIILCQGGPGLGKTLTAEVVAEANERPLYTIQCSQLGTDPDTLEKELIACLRRGARWGAIVLLDEADVYIQTRGDDLQKNAVIGVFLRVLEYHTSTLFLTTNRGDDIDDAIVSRALALITYRPPTRDLRLRIWAMLLAENGVSMNKEEIERLSAITLSGRDIKNLLKLALIMNKEISHEVIVDLIKFRPVTKEAREELCQTNASAS